MCLQALLNWNQIALACFNFSTDHKHYAGNICLRELKVIGRYRKKRCSDRPLPGCFGLMSSLDSRFQQTKGLCPCTMMWGNELKLTRDLGQSLLTSIGMFLHMERGNFLHLGEKHKWTVSNIWPSCKRWAEPDMGWLRACSQWRESSFWCGCIWSYSVTWDFTYTSKENYGHCPSYLPRLKYLPLQVPTWIMHWIYKDFTDRFNHF